MDCSSPGSSIHGIFQARVLEWVAISFSGAPSWLRDRTQVSHTAGRCFTLWATREPPAPRRVHSSTICGGEATSPGGLLPTMCNMPTVSAKRTQVQKRLFISPQGGIHSVEQFMFLSHLKDLPRLFSSWDPICAQLLSPTLSCCTCSPSPESILCINHINKNSWLGSDFREAYLRCMAYANQV